VQHLFVVKNIFSLCCWKHHNIRVARVNGGGVVFLLVEFFFLSSPLKIRVWSSLLVIFKFQFLLFKFLIFFLCFFRKVLLVFNFILQSKFMVLFFSIWSLLSWFFSYSFVKVLFVCNFIIQSKFMLYYFYQFGSHFFSFVKVIFLFNFTIQ